MCFVSTDSLSFVATGALDRFVLRLSSIEAPSDLRVALKTVYVCLAKKYARRAMSSLAYLLLGELFGNTIRNINQERDMDKLTPDGKRFLESMASVLAKLSLNESFAGGSKLYHMNSWIQSRFETLEKCIEKLLAVEEPVMVPWNSGCTVQGSLPNLQFLMRALTEHRDQINHRCMSHEWLAHSTRSLYLSRLPILWAALVSGHRRGSLTAGGSADLSSPPRSCIEKASFRDKQERVQQAVETFAHTDLIGQMVNMVTQRQRKNEVKPASIECGASRMQHLSATVIEMDLESKDLAAMPKLMHFKNLHTLKIPRNRIQELGDLPWSLKILDCSHNQLSTLNGVECLFNLESLDASHNRLEEAMSALVNTSRMVSLNLAHNWLDCASKETPYPCLALTLRREEYVNEMFFDPS